MQQNTIRILASLFCILSVSTTSCKKFLATYSQNGSFIESAADLDELLVGESYYKTATPEMLLSMDDDVEMGRPDRTYPELLRTGFFHWQAEPRMDSDGKIAVSDNFFTVLYQKIASVNTILHHVPLLKEKNENAAILQRISGEAHFLRAYYYFMLANTYGKPYKPATATGDFSVPLKTDIAVKGQFTSRSTNRLVFDQIISDLLEAEKELADANQSSSIRVSQAAAQALLSRVYLYMENYDKALFYADAVISRNNYQITDLNNYTGGEDFLVRNAPEVLFTMGGSGLPLFMQLAVNTPGAVFYKVSDELAAAYLQTDLRRQAFFFLSARGDLKAAKKRKVITPTIDDVSDIFLIRLSEIYLNKAEALAALEQPDEARASLQELRKKRFRPAELTAITATGPALVNAIREERRLELCFETHRWFDLRRYAVNTKYPFSKTIRHRSIVFSGNAFQENGYYELLPYDQDAAAYIVPIANDEIVFNNGLLSNERRPARPLKQ